MSLTGFLRWSRLGDSALQRQDVVQLLERTWERLDRDYVEKWVGELGLRSEWESACRKLTEAKGEDGVRRVQLSRNFS